MRLYPEDAQGDVERVGAVLAIPSTWTCQSRASGRVSKLATLPQHISLTAAQFLRAS